MAALLRIFKKRKLVEIELVMADFDQLKTISSLVIISRNQSLLYPLVSFFFYINIIFNFYILLY